MVNLRIESIDLTCEVVGCKRVNLVFDAAGVDVAEFLRGAIWRGWRLIEPDASDITTWPDGIVEIRMNGLCPNCADVVRRNVPQVKENVLGAGSNARK